jgi:hypothetical protein
MTDALSFTDPFTKYIEVYKDTENNGYWFAMVYGKEEYEQSTEQDQPTAIDVFAAIDELALLTRVQYVHHPIVIAYTDGEVKDVPPWQF